MDFGVLPPEINSARMYSGPGSGPLRAAAAAWDGLATELTTTAASYSSVISELTSQEWLGLSSMSMAAAPFAAWMSATAAQAEQAASQAHAAASAYEAAFTMTVDPAEIVANRIQTMSLIASNILGQNTPAIAAREAHYGEMWAQDIVAMHGYASSSAAATKLTSFTSPPQTTNPSGLAGQAATVAKAAMPAQTLLADLLASLGPIGDGSLVSLNIISTLSLAATTASMSSSFAGTAEAYRNGHQGESSPPVEPGPVEEPNLVSAALMSRSGSAAVAASTGGANPVGGLSVPPSWATAPAMRQVATALPTTAVPMVMQYGQTSQDSPYAGIALASLLGSSMAGLAFRGAPAASGAAMTPEANKAPAATIVAPNKPAPTAAPAATPPPPPPATKEAFPTAAPVAMAAPGIPADVAAKLAATIASIPGATIIVIPAPPPN